MDAPDFDDDEFPLQFGIAMDENGTPVVVMVLPDVEDRETGKSLHVLLGDDKDAEAFATQTLQAALVARQIADELGPDPTESHRDEVLGRYAAMLSAPFN